MMRFDKNLVSQSLNVSLFNYVEHATPSAEFSHCMENLITAIVEMRLLTMPVQTNAQLHRDFEKWVIPLYRWQEEILIKRGSEIELPYFAHDFFIRMIANNERGYREKYMPKISTIHEILWSGQAMRVFNALTDDEKMNIEMDRQNWFAEEALIQKDCEEAITEWAEESSQLEF